MAKEEDVELPDDCPAMSVDEMTPIALEESLANSNLKANFLWGRCTNRTGETLAVYGPGNKLYCLPAGRSTPDNWDCDGFFVPNDRVANQLLSKVRGPVAVKYVDGIHFEPTRTGVDYHCGGNQGVYKPGQINWPIPNIAYRDVVRGCS